MTSLPAYRYPNTKVIVFAKEPLAGQVKTRLLTQLSAERALALHIAMLKWVCGQIRRSQLCPIALYVTSNPQHKAFLSLCNKKDIYTQSGDDLGAKMANAAEQCLLQPDVDKVLLVGADCPAIDGNYIHQAIAALDAGNQVVIGPASDGGYVLLGLQSVYSELFENINWGSDKVLSQTTAGLAATGRAYHLLPTLWDVDRPEDLSRLKTELPHFDY